MLFRNENPVLGPSTQLQETGASATSTSSLVTNTFKPATREIVNFDLSAVKNTAANLSSYVFIAPWACQIVGIRWNCVVKASVSTTLDIQKITADAVAPGSGTSLLSAALNINSGVTNNTRLNVSLTSTGSALQLNAGDQIAYNLSGAPTSLAGGDVQIEVVQLG
jgi:hypothetical protein